MEQSDSKALFILQSLDGKYVKRWVCTSAGQNTSKLNNCINAD